MVLDKENLSGKSFRFSWKSESDGGVNGIALLRADGTIDGIGSPNEAFWTIDERGRLIFKHADGRTSTIFDRSRIRAGGHVFEGPFQFRKGVVHFLEETGERFVSSKMHVISPGDAARIKYSRQEFVYLDIGESSEFRLKDGTSRTVRLVSVAEHRDSVVNLIRSADVLVEIDGAPLELLCAPYVMPTETGGLRIQADTTSGWVKIPKRVQLSLWDASDPIVDADLFQFPLRGYGLFSHGMQCFNEPVHLGHRDDDPKGQIFYHNYGFDMAGYEGREEVVCAVDGVVVRLHPAGEPSNIAIEDDLGIIWEYDHLDSIDPGIKEGMAVRRGQDIGILGRKGPSGNFSHLHVGAYLSRAHLGVLKNNRNLNLYPWMVAAYRETAGTELHAVAQPHKMALTGERVLFDATNSLAFGATIASYTWVFHDGKKVTGASAERIYTKPGLYMAALWVRDGKGRKDVDFCRVKVFTRDDPEEFIPTIFVTHHPSAGNRAGESVLFRLWPQGGEVGPIHVDFGDGGTIADLAPYAEVGHSFETPGIHIVTASAAADSISVTQKVKVVVEP